MTANDADADNGSVSRGDIVRSPAGRKWVVIDPDTDLDGETFHWMEAVSDRSEHRGIGRATFGNEGWEVLD